MSTILYDGGYTTESAVSSIRNTAPIPGFKGRYFLEQDFQILFDNFTPLEIGAAHPDFGTYYLVEESPLTKVIADVVQWTRMYAQIPTAWDEGESTVYTFPAIPDQGETPPQKLVRGLPVNLTVPQRLHYDYFKTDDPFNDIAIIEQFQVFNGLNEIVTQVMNGLTETVPSRTVYQNWIDDGTEIVSVASVITRWRGNIWQRVTKYVRAH